MTAGGPMGYTARPEAMCALISTLYATRLFERGVPRVRVGLMTAYADERAAAELAIMKRRPASEAIGAALDVMARVWDEAMTMHGMFRWTIDECQRRVRLELEEAVDEHITLVRKTAEAGRPELNRQVEPGSAAGGQHERLCAQMRTSGAVPIAQRYGRP